MKDQLQKTEFFLIFIWPEKKGNIVVIQYYKLVGANIKKLKTWKWRQLAVIFGNTLIVTRISLTYEILLEMDNFIFPMSLSWELEKNFGALVGFVTF